MGTAGSPDRPGLDDPGRGRRIGIDVGTVRIGVASCDPEGILATPVETVQVSAKGKSWNRQHTDIQRIVKIIHEYEAVEVIVGLPQTLKAEQGIAAKNARNFGRELASAIDPVPVRFADERLTTVTAQRSLRESGVSARGQRAMVDQVAAVTILQGWLDERKVRLLADKTDFLE